jgi:hypothetical protein
MRLALLTGCLGLFSFPLGHGSFTSHVMGTVRVLLALEVVVLIVTILNVARLALAFTLARIYL